MHNHEAGSSSKYIIDNNISGTRRPGQGTRFTWLNFVGHLPFNRTRLLGPSSSLIMIAITKVHDWRLMVVVIVYIVVFVLQPF